MLTASVLFSGGCGGKIKTGKVMQEETPYAYVISQLGDDVMPVMSYIAPMGEITIDGQSYPSSITDDVYSKMKELGINLMDGVGGYYGRDDWTKATLELCDKYGIAALIGSGTWYSSFRSRFYADGKITPFAEMSEAQQQYIKNAMFSGFEKWAGYDCFAGINYTDELGIAAAPSLKEAQDLFLAKYPDKLMLNNCVGGGAIASTMQYNGFTEDFANKAGLKETEIAKKINNGWGWDAYIDAFIDTVRPQVFLTMITHGEWVCKKLLLNFYKNSNTRQNIRRSINPHSGTLFRRVNGLPRQTAINADCRLTANLLIKSTRRLFSVRRA